MFIIILAKSAMIGQAATQDVVAIPALPRQIRCRPGIALAADPSRDGLGYEAGWQSYHCELNDPAFPAVMDDYWRAHDTVPEHCQHDLLTRMFLLDRVRAKLVR